MKVDGAHRQVVSMSGSLGPSRRHARCSMLLEDETNRLRPSFRQNPSSAASEEKARWCTGLMKKICGELVRKQQADACVDDLLVLLSQWAPYRARGDRRQWQCKLQQTPLCCISIRTSAPSGSGQNSSCESMAGRARRWLVVCVPDRADGAGQATRVRGWDDQIRSNALG